MTPASASARAPASTPCPPPGSLWAGFPALLACLWFALAAPAQAQTSQTSTLEDQLFAPFDALYAAAVPQAQADLLHVQTPPSAAAVWDIDASNPNLVWSGEPGKSQVLVATFTKAAYYTGYKSGQTIPAAVDLWVTPAPQMYQDVRAEAPELASANGKLAASMYLGLPARNANDTVLTFWASPSSMLRPAIDPAIDSHQAEAAFPLTLQTVANVAAVPLPQSAPAPGFGTAPDYPVWFAQREGAIFNPSISGGPYPWTGLGYTYDWNPAAADTVGGSEFIVVKGSPITIKDIAPASRYFN
ncbi:hypothetical protein [Fundidesulfovibrio agrisoli]|uniref:hypothetical protein n=1 Tax=Fundidesulfovibrio agrisoli TaxID=2922717 RepID=UPI001FAC017B|nr:hypothetical protein [Fundidesulfovibrio agrisoli]